MEFECSITQRRVVVLPRTEDLLDFITNVDPYKFVEPLRFTVNDLNRALELLYSSGGRPQARWYRYYDESQYQRNQPIRQVSVSMVGAVRNEQSTPRRSRTPGFWSPTP